MLNFRGLNVWNASNQSLEHRYTPGSPHAVFADTVIECIKEGESIGVTPSQLFSPLKTKEVAAFRGFLMVSTYDILIALEIAKSIKETAAGIYGRDRGTINRFIQTAEDALDPEYEKVCNSQAGKNIEAHLKKLLTALKT